MEKSIKVWQFVVSNVIVILIFVFGLLYQNSTIKGAKIDNKADKSELEKIDKESKTRDSVIEAKMDSKVDKDAFNEVKNDIRDIRNYILKVGK